MKIIINDIFFNDSNLSVLHVASGLGSIDSKSIFIGLKFPKLTEVLEIHGEHGNKISELIDRKYSDYQNFSEAVICNPSIEYDLPVESLRCPLIRINLLEETGQTLECEVEIDNGLHTDDLFIKMRDQVKVEIESVSRTNYYQDLYKYFHDKSVELIDCFRYQAAKELLNEALEYFPNKQGFKINLGLCQCELEEYSDATETLNDILKLDNKCYLAYINKAILFRKLRKYNLSIINLKIAYKIDICNTQAIRELAITYGEMGKTKKALQYAKILLDAEPEEEESYLILGFVYERMGKYKKAINAFNHILNEINPFDHWALINRGKILFEKFDETDKALYDIKLAQNLGNPFANELIDEINNEYL
jgi:tetratricopeptide (TPR) repeat protein